MSVRDSYRKILNIILRDVRDPERTLAEDWELHGGEVA